MLVLDPVSQPVKTWVIMRGKKTRRGLRRRFDCQKKMKREEEWERKRKKKMKRKEEWGRKRKKEKDNEKREEGRGKEERKRMKKERTGS